MEGRGEQRRGGDGMRVLARLAAIACVAGAGLALGAAAPEPQAGARPLAERVVEPAAALRAYRDPMTGEFGEPPPGVATESSAAMGRALPPLRQRRSPVRGGGVIADLGGRFQSVVRASAGPGGVDVRCDAAVEPAPGAPAGSGTGGPDR